MTKARREDRLPSYLRCILAIEGKKEKQKSNPQINTCHACMELFNIWKLASQRTQSMMPVPTFLNSRGRGSSLLNSTSSNRLGKTGLGVTPSQHHTQASSASLDSQSFLPLLNLVPRLNHLTSSSLLPSSLNLRERKARLPTSMSRDSQGGSSRLDLTAPRHGTQDRSFPLTSILISESPWREKERREGTDPDPE